jgi:uncharacterized membrane protein YccC
VASVVAWQLCIWLGAQQPPIFAVIVPLVALRDAPYSALNVSMVRLIGVVGGVLIGIAVLHVIRPSALAVGLVLAIALPFGMLLRVGGAFNVQVAVSALLVFASPDPDAYAAARLWETAVGAAVTVILAALLFPPNPYRTFVASRDEAVTQLADELRTGAQLSGGEDRAGLGGLVDRVLRTEAAGRALPRRSRRGSPGRSRASLLAAPVHAATRGAGSHRRYDGTRGPADPGVRRRTRRPRPSSGLAITVGGERPANPGRGRSAGAGGDRGAQRR